MGEGKKLTFDKYAVILILILIFAAGIRLYFFFQFQDQPVWWDESEHLLKAKNIAFGTPDTGWNASREIMLPFLFSILLKIFNSEAFVRFIQVVLSFSAVLLTYFLGKEMFNKSVGLFAAFGMAIFAEFLFWTIRFGLEPIGISFSLAAILFFWKGYIKKQKKSFIYLSAFFAALALISNSKEVSLILPLILLAVFKDGFAFLKNKNLWIAALVGLITLSPFMLYYYNTVGHPLPRIEAIGTAVLYAQTELGWSWSNFFGFMRYFTNYLTPPLLIVFLASLLYISANIIIGFDLRSKGHGEILKYLFLIFLMAFPLFTFSYFYGHDPTSPYMEPRLIIESFPAVFILLGVGFTKIYDVIKIYRKEAAILVIALILISGTFYQLRQADSMIKARSGSFQQVKDAGLWMKENSSPGDWIISASAPQTTYYSERSTWGPPETEEEFIELVKDLKPKFLVISIFEPHPNWYIQWPIDNQEDLLPVQGYADQAGNPILIVYEFKNYDF